MGIWSSKCKNQLELEQKTIELFLKYDNDIYVYLNRDGINKSYTEFKKTYSTIEQLQKYKKDKEPKGGTQNRRKTRRNRFVKR